MESYYSYIVRCKDGSLYTGWTMDIEKRVEQHNQGTGAKYTRAKRPVTLVYSKEFTSKSEAMQWEYEIKTFSREKKLKLIELEV